MRNKIFLFIFLIFSSFSYSQSHKTYKIANVVDSVGIEFSHIILNDNILTYSDENGEFKLEKDIKVDSLKISHLAYFSKIIYLNDLKAQDVFYLTPKMSALDEVVLNVSRKERSKKILPKRSKKDALFKSDDISFPYSYEFAVFVPNYNNENLLIKSIVLESKKRESRNDDKYIPFRVNLMSIDTVTHLPKEKIFKEDLTVGKLENQHLVSIDLEEQGEVVMPKEGICVVVSLYSEEYYLKNGFTKRPAFGVVQIEHKSEFREYRKHYLAGNQSWVEAGYSETREQCFNVGVEVVPID